MQQAATLAAARAYLPLLLPDVLLVEPAVAPSAELAAFLRTLPPAVVAAGVGATLSGGEDSPLACDPVVVLLTSLASDDDRLRGLPAEGCLHKPFRFCRARPRGRASAGVSAWTKRRVRSGVCRIRCGRSDGRRTWLARSAEPGQPALR